MNRTKSLDMSETMDKMAVVASAIEHSSSDHAEDWDKLTIEGALFLDAFFAKHHACLGLRIAVTFNILMNYLLHLEDHPSEDDNDKVN